MKGLPNIAKWRLSASLIPQTDTHPDFGVLTAFIEGSLAKKQRNEILLHLAGCAQCNQLVSLSVPPANEHAVRPKMPKIKTTWNLWNLVPVPRIAVPAVSAALVLLAVWATHLSPIEAPVSRVAAVPTTVAPTPSGASVDTVRASATKSPKQTTDSPSTSPHMVEVAKASPGARGVVVPEQIGGLSRNAANVSIQTAVLPPAPAVTTVETSTPPPLISSVSAPAAGPCWRVSDAGKLQKSDKCGDAWQDISFASPITVRVMHSVANSVWVGGNGGALYHSDDGGEHWNSVTVPLLIDDIVAIAFATPAHGRLATANGATWATNDGGHTWNRQ